MCSITDTNVNLPALNCAMCNNKLAEASYPSHQRLTVQKLLQRDIEYCIATERMNTINVNAIHK